MLIVVRYRGLEEIFVHDDVMAELVEKWNVDMGFPVHLCT